jgi:FKBP-type peptidyl-prolyl cis-trans isomerase FkpA
MKLLVAISIVLISALPASAAGTLKTEEQKTLYGVGLVIARQLSVFNLTPRELRLVNRGISDGVRGRKPRVDFAAYSKKSREMGIARRNAHGKQLERKAGAFMEKAGSKPGAVKTHSGLIYLPLLEGVGSSPVDTDIVKLHHRSTLIDGKEMDSSYKRGTPDEAPLNEFLKCLTEGVQMMKPGGKARLVCPPETGLGKEGSGIIPPDAVLVFEVELLEVKKNSDVQPE